MIFMNSVRLAKAIRMHSLKMTSLGKSSHIGSVFSIADILAVLYNSILRVNNKDPKMHSRDRFILSKGHAGAGVYAALAEKGFFPKKKLETHYQNGSDLSGHVSHKNINGVEFSTGSLGHGLSVGAGIAKALKLSNNDRSRVFVLLSDGECNEGSNWEAIMFANHHKLNNLIVVVDYNKIQSLDTTENTLSLEPFNKKWESFGWNVFECDGHDHNQIHDNLMLCKNDEKKPSVLIANTIKGKGVSFMEGSVLWHYRTAQGKEYEEALKELKAG
tara:strand:+ start:726 stop:1544 length:819 start_codon:yes stop_codon:yes gene_type:complete